MATVGEQLRQAREAQKLEIHEIADQTKIRGDHIRALEAGNYSVFSAPVYIRGFVRTYANQLHLDAAKIMEQLGRELADSGQVDPSLAPASRSALDRAMFQLAQGGRRLLVPATLGVVVVIVAVAAYFWSAIIGVMIQPPAWARIITNRRPIAAIRFLCRLCVSIDMSQTSVVPSQAGPAAAPRLSQLRGLDYSVVQQCMHCGLCLPTCPTYDATKLERNSPRGRIALMRAIADGRLEPTRTFADEMYFCLGCLACMTACPAGVNYAELFEHARAEAEESGVLRSPKRSLVRWLTLRWLFMDLRRLRLAGALIRLYQRLGLQWLLRGCGALKLAPRRWRELEAMTPVIQPKFSGRLIAPVTPAEGGRKYRVALLTGCAQDLMFSDVNRDTAEVLARNGCEVATPVKQNCCGSLHAHNGELGMARELARKSIDQFPPDQFDAIISNAAGCGSHLKHYGQLLADDAAYRARAEAWDAKLKDIHEWLAAIGLTPPRAGIAAQTVTYHEACHLCHGQKITGPPRQLLRAIPGLTLVELPESDWCCGSAGIYNLIQPEMATQLLDRKLKHIVSTHAPIVATGKPGCLAHLANGLRRDRLELRLVHPVTLLAEAYRAELDAGA